MVFLYLFFISLPIPGWSILPRLDGGERWQSHGFLAKIYANGQREIRSCVGTVITPSLVLTTWNCTMGTSNFIVVLPWTGNTHLFNGMKKAIYVNANAERPIHDFHRMWTFLRLETPLDIGDLCPPDPALKRVARLQFKPTLLNSSLIDIPTSLYTTRQGRCFMLGFKSASDNHTANMEELFTSAYPPPKPNASFLIQTREFVNRQEILLVNISPLEEEAPTDILDDLYTSRVVDDQQVACPDEDGGSPLFCDYPPYGQIQIGAFQRLKHNSNGVEQKCGSGATEMHFSLNIGWPMFVETLEKYDDGKYMTELFATYKACNFI